jgi:hypothetical protein
MRVFFLLSMITMLSTSSSAFNHHNTIEYGVKDTRELGILFSVFSALSLFILYVLIFIFILCVRACVRVCVRAFMRPCVCVCACMRPCVCVCMLFNNTHLPSLYIIIDR